MLESACPYFTQLVLLAVLVSTQHWQSGQQCSCWLVSIWLFASFNLPRQYFTLSFGSLAALPPGSCCSRMQSNNLNLLWKFKFKFTSKLISIISTFNVLPQIWKLKFKKCWSYKFETLQWHAHWQPGQLQQHVLVRWSWTGKPDWSCRPGVTVLFMALQ